MQQYLTIRIIFLFQYALEACARNGIPFCIGTLWVLFDVQVQKMPLDGNVQMNLPWNLSPEEIHMIHRTAEDAAANQRREQQIDNDMQEVRTDHCYGGEKRT